MNLKIIIKNHSQFNSWANDKMIEYLKNEPESILTAQAASSFPSITETLNHMAESQDFWHGVVIKSDIKPGISHLEPSSQENAFAYLSESSKSLTELIEGLTTSQLSTPINTPWIVPPIPIYEVFQHCFNHSTYHRGQVTTILRQLGYTSIVMTDFYEYLKVVCYTK